MYLPAQRNQTGFTLIELLIVIAIIATLSAILIPAIGMIRRQAKDATCRNNLQQIGMGITAFQQLHNNYFPPSLGELLKPGEPLADESDKILHCPYDPEQGKNPLMGRGAPPNWGDISELYQVVNFYAPDGTNVIKSVKPSYCFEAANIALGTTASQWTEPWWGSTHNSSGTWMGAKLYQLKYGKNGGPYETSRFPIVRCFHHKAWGTNPATEHDKKVLNLAWDMSIFWSTPEWENDI